MKKDEVQIGKLYWKKVSGTLARVRLNGVSPYGGWDAVNVDTRRAVRVRSAASLRSEVKPKRCGVCPNCVLISEKLNEFRRLFRTETDDAGRARVKGDWAVISNTHPCRNPIDVTV